MKRKKTKIILVSIIILIFCIFLLLNREKQPLQDDIIFFKSFYLGENKEQSNKIKIQNQSSIISYENSNNLLNYNAIKNKIKSEKENQNKAQRKEYVFKVSYKNTDFEEINLLNTINKDSLVNEKIAPGTSGGFEIVLETNQKINYQIKFKSKNDKPENLIFQIEGKDKKYKKLEEMEQDLKGEIEQDKKIAINWEWEYEKDTIQNIQDTKDGEKLIKYNFTIYAIGYE